MKTTIEFDDKLEAVIALRSLELYSELINIREAVNRCLKHEGDKDTCLRGVLDSVTEAVYGLGDL